MLALGAGMAGRIPKAPLTGLAEAWEADERVRRRMLHEGRLLLWLKPEQTGIPSMGNAKLNTPVLQPLFKIWANSCTKPRTPTLESVRKQARFSVIETCG